MLGEYICYSDSMSFCQLELKSVMAGKSRSALASKSVWAGKGPVLTAMVNILAATPARMPKGAFSTTKAS